MAYELIITEKPQAAKKIAGALADKKAVKESINKVPYYKLSHKNKDIVVGCAVGHLYTLTEKEKKGMTYPVFDVKWEQASKVSKAAKFSSKYVTALKKLAKSASQFIVATDYDLEGEVIGLNILRFICKKKDGRRMKFSTLTKDELIGSYEHAANSLNWGLANAGVTRHEMDWYYGINLSRALTSAVKSAGTFKLLSSGRVQGPALKIIVDKEKAIKAFVPEPFWQIELHGKAKEKAITALHKEDKFWEKEQAQKVMEKVQGQKAFVHNIEKTQFKQAPPTPFDLTTLQIEAYRTLRIQPKNTLAAAQNLYVEGLISYPRTSSQKLPKEIGYKKILSQLLKQDYYKELAQKLLDKEVLKPNEGKKTDPAHPAIYPTGHINHISGNEAKIYDLIVRRFLATFAEEAVRETVKIDIDINKEIFIAKGTRTLQPGWHLFYGPHVKIEEAEMPALVKGDEVAVESIDMLDKETQPPRRYTPASIIKELEKRNLGTKCLTSDTLVKINSNNQIHHVKIAELFDSLYSNFPLKDTKDMKIAINNKKTCFSFNEFEESRSLFKLVSKRKLNKNEKVYRIAYKDGSVIELTEDHPILIFDGNSCKYIPTKSIKKGMKSVASIKFPEKEGGIICTWEDFLKRSDLKTKLYGISNEILTRRKKQHLSQQSFGRKYGIAQSAICGYEKSQSIPFYVIKKLNLSKPKSIASANKNIIIKNPFPLGMSSPLARILANLVGDCSIDTKKIIKENCYDFRYHNTNINLINRFIKDIKNIFGIDLVIRLRKTESGRRLPKYYVRIPAVIGRIISILFTEVIKKNAVKIPPQFYPEFIGSLFDDEGHSMKSEPKLFISNTNFKLLRDVRQMLSTLDINALLDKKQFKLYIRGRYNIQKFLEKIPFASTEKKQRLVNNLSRFYKFGKKLSSPQKQFQIMSVINSSKEKELTNREISEKLGYDMAKSKHHLSLLIKNGYIKRTIKGISEYPRKRITYKLAKPMGETFFKYLDEEVISADFITKTIVSVKKIDYNGFVYDITNNPEIPNFILSNGVVVHNSTRAAIIDALYKRGYILEKAIQATDIGIRTCEILEKYSPSILDEELTRHFELEMEKIREGKKKSGEVLAEAKEVLTKILTLFKQKEKDIGKELAKATIETRDEANYIGPCPVCKAGDLMIRRGKFGRFIACSKYPECKTTFSLPARGLVRSLRQACEQCGYPMISIQVGKKAPQQICTNPECPSKKIKKEKEAIEKSCPKCGKPLVLRSSIYGSFYGCTGYPKCRHTEKIEE